MPLSYTLNCDLTTRTREISQPRAGRKLTDEDVRQIAENVTGFFSILAEWSRTPAIDAGSFVASDNAEVRHER
jgi:hypothetical protein